MGRLSVGWKRWQGQPRFRAGNICGWLTGPAPDRKSLILRLDPHPAIQTTAARRWRLVGNVGG